jgi:hypothetical protein
VKLGDYATMGIATIRVVDPSNGAIYRYDGGRLEPLDRSRQELPDGRCFIDWDTVRALLD